MKKRGTTNPNLGSLLRTLRKAARANEANIWKDVAEYLFKSRRKRIAINISRINRYTQEGDVVIVPGKVLGAGILRHQVTVAAFDFSEQARRKIVEVKGKCLSIPELIKLNPKGSNIKIIG